MPEDDSRSETALAVDQQISTPSQIVPQSEASDSSETGKESSISESPTQSNQPSNLKNVCRDFLRNVCFRGNQCKFSHPGDSIHGDLVFCHDFQNLGCNRYDCKFVHATKEDERRYMESGKLSSNASNVSSNDGGEPICKDFLKRQCHRGRRCKFRHDGAPGSPVSETNGHTLQRDTIFSGYYEDRFNDPEHFTSSHPLSRVTQRFDREHWSPLGPPSKRRRSSGHILVEDEQHLFVGSIERENRLLRDRVNALQKQVSDLLSTNEFLLQQNAELRLTKTRTCPGAVMSSAAVLSSSVLPNTVLTSNLANGVSACPMPNGVLSNMSSAVLSASAPITSEPVSLVPVSSIITMSSSSTPLVSGYPIVTSDCQLRFNPTRN